MWEPEVMLEDVEPLCAGAQSFAHGVNARVPLGAGPGDMFLRSADDACPGDMFRTLLALSPVVPVSPRSLGIHLSLRCGRSEPHARRTLRTLRNRLVHRRAVLRSPVAAKLGRSGATWHAHVLVDNADPGTVRRLVADLPGAELVRVSSPGHRNLLLKHYLPNHLAEPESFSW